MNLKSIAIEREKLEKRIAELDAEKNKILSRKTIQCVKCNHGPGCGARTQIRKLTYIQTFYYVNEVYNEHWEPGEGQFDCPKCGQRNRLTDVWGHAGRQEFSKLKRLFASIVEVENR